MCSPTFVNYSSKFLNLRKRLDCTNHIVFPAGQKYKQQAGTSGIGNVWSGYTRGEWKVEDILGRVERVVHLISGGKCCTERSESIEKTLSFFGSDFPKSLFYAFVNSRWQFYLIQFHKSLESSTFSPLLTLVAGQLYVIVILIAFSPWLRMVRTFPCVYWLLCLCLRSM